MQFNTQRGYSADGQPIECEVVGKGMCDILETETIIVKFIDLARGITGIVEVDYLTPEAVMRAYDCGNYRLA